MRSIGHHEAMAELVRQHMMSAPMPRRTGTPLPSLRATG